VAVTAAAITACSTLAVPLAGPAEASVPTERVWTVRDTDGDDTRGLYYSDGAGGTQVKVEESSTVDLYGLSASGDGSRIVYLRFTYLPATNDVRQEVVVRDTSTQQVRVPHSSLYSSGTYPNVASLSPDGNRAVWEVVDTKANTHTTYKAMVTSGSASVLVAGLVPYSFLSNDVVLIQTLAGVPYTIPFAGGAKAAVSGLSVDAISARPSPDGTKLVFGLITSYDEPYTSLMQVAPLTLNGGTATVGAATTVHAVGENAQPSFSRDGSTVYWINRSGLAGAKGDVWSAPEDGSGTAAAVAVTTENEIDVATTELPGTDTTAPSAATPLPAVLNGVTPTVKWALPAESDVSGVLVRIYHDRNLSVAPWKTYFVPAPVTSLTTTLPWLDATYTYTFTAVDRSGNASTTTERPLTAIKAGLSFADPTSTSSITAPFYVVFAGQYSPKYVVYKADYMIWGTNTWRPWVNTTGFRRLFGAPASTGVAATTSTPGANYVFRVSATDAFGNATAVRSSTRAVVPFDQTKAVFSGGSTVTKAGAYLGTYRRLTKTTEYAKVVLVGNRLQIIGWQCQVCGKFTLHDNGKLIATIDTRLSHTKGRAVLYTRSYPTVGTHTYVIRLASALYSQEVQLDGFAMRR